MAISVSCGSGNLFHTPWSERREREDLEPEMAFMKQRDHALELVDRAYEQARKKAGAGPIAMGLPVLKNRLLTLTDRKFRCETYGAQSIREFADGLAPELHLLEGSTLYAFTPPRRDEVHKEAASPNELESANEFPLSTSRIREDLWRAVMDYASGLTYEWDPVNGLARAKEGDEDNPVLPTVAAEELSSWRAEFVKVHAGSLGAADLVLAQQWQEQGLPTHYLPKTLLARWNKELNLRVKLRLDEFFVSHIGDLKLSAVNARQESATADEMLEDARNRGDGFTVGALLIARLQEATDDEGEALLAQAIAAWSSPQGFHITPKSLKELSALVDGVPQATLAIALINTLAYIGSVGEELREAINGFAYKIKAGLIEAFGADDRSPAGAVRLASSKFEETLSQARAGVVRFQRSTPVTAKIASVELLKIIARMRKFMIADDQQIASDLTILLGPAFRKLCEAYERNADVEVIRRAPEYLRNVQLQKLSEGDPRQRSRMWRELVQPVVDHLGNLVEEASLRGETALAPALGLRNSRTKADLLGAATEIQVSFSLVNSGKGSAQDVSLRRFEGELQLACIDPPSPFSIPPGAERVVRLSLKLDSPVSEIEIPIEWECSTTAEKRIVFSEHIHIDQQMVVPDWDALMKDSPYGINPINRPERLYGRSGTLRSLHYAAMARTSHFVWGQKRIGKTSLLQVLGTKLDQDGDAICVLLRMGELTSLHEGQIARLMATRLVKKLPAMAVPDETEFGAGLGRLVPFVDELVKENPEKKFVVIIDEFDDLDPSLYTGERGKQFIKALRSVSEVGLTFFFVGSERMDAIFSRHQSDLNKWINERLDRIDSRDDCRALIADPLAGSIEFSEEAVDFIIDYAAGNTFYMHNFCYQLLLRCLKEYRTYIDVNDAYAVRQQMLSSLGPTNFAHFWEDNPVLDAHEKMIQSGENCIALCCIASLGGRFESVDEVVEAQETVGLKPEERASEIILRNACSRLMKRHIIQNGNGEAWVVALPLFREWLGANAIAHLLPIWHEARLLPKPSRQGGKRVRAVRDEGIFIVPEDDLLAVAQRLLIFGKQKDVAEIRSWLRQFDDDSRIEIAFALLKRLSERGFVNDGMRALGYQRMAEMIEAHRSSVGQPLWKVVKARNDNLAVAYLDAEHKSGATTAREVSRVAKAGKIGPASEMAQWMAQHQQSEPILVIADDFAGTGSTLVKGLRKMQARVPAPLWKWYLENGRVFVIVMYAFGEAIELIRTQFPGIRIAAYHLLAEELRACDERADIFSTDAERQFAIEVLTQIGRELSPSHPLGHGDMGALFVMHNTTPNNTLPIFWCGGTVGERPWVPLFPRA